MGVVKDWFNNLIHGDTRGAFDDLLNTLSYVPVIGDIIGGVLLTAEIIKLVKDLVKDGKSLALIFGTEEGINALTMLPRVGDVIGGVLLTAEMVEQVKEVGGSYRFEDVGRYETIDGIIVDHGPMWYVPPVSWPVSWPDEEDEEKYHPEIPFTYPKKCKRLCTGFGNGNCKVRGCEGYNGDIISPESIHLDNKRRHDLDRWRSVCGCKF